MARNELEIILREKREGEGAKKAKTSLDNLKESVKKLALAYVSMQTVQKAIDFVEFGANVKRQSNALDGLAQSAGTSGAAITQAIQGASDFTIDRMTAMSAASKAMMLDVAQTPEQFERLTKVATSLGRAMGQDAAKSIDDFVVAAGRQSMQIADNLGLTIRAEQAYQRFAQQQGKTAAELTNTEKKMAFLNEMLVEGERKMADLGDTSLDLQGQFERIGARAKDAKADLAELAAEMVEVTGRSAEFVLTWGGRTEDALANTDRWIDRLKEAATAGIQMVGAGSLMNRVMAEHGDKLAMVAQTVGLVALKNQQYSKSIDEAALRVEQWTFDEEDLRYALEDTSNAIDHVNYMSEGRIKALKVWRPTQAQLEKTILDTIEALEEEAEATEKAKEKTAELADAQRNMAFDAALSLTSFYRQGKEQAEDFAEERERIEQEHQEKVAELQKQGQAHYVEIDEEGERLKLDILKERLAEALTKQSEFNEDTTKLTRLRAQEEINSLQSQITQKTSLLESANNGYLMMQGQNISEELAAEHARYDEQLRLLEENRAAQEEAQRQSLGRMMLQWFESWASMNDISSEKAMEMRLAIAKEYGLMDEKSAKTIDSMVHMWGTYAESSTLSADAVVENAKRIVNAINSIPTKRTVDVHLTYRASEPGQGPALTQQHGGYVPYGGLYSVGEAGRELVALPAGARVFNATETAQMLSRAIGGRRSIPALGAGPTMSGGRTYTNYYDQRVFYVYAAENPEATANKIAELGRMKGGRVPV